MHLEGRGAGDRPPRPTSLPMSPGSRGCTAAGPSAALQECLAESRLNAERSLRVPHCWPGVGQPRARGFAAAEPGASRPQARLCSPAPWARSRSQHPRGALVCRAPQPPAAGAHTGQTREGPAGQVVRGFRERCAGRPAATGSPWPRALHQAGHERCPRGRVHAAGCPAWRMQRREAPSPAEEVVVGEVTPNGSA